MVDEIHQFSLDEVEVVQFEYSRGLENQNLDNFRNADELIILFVVVDELKKNFSKEEAILISFGFSDKEALVAQSPFSTNRHQELDDVPQACVVVSLWMEFFKQVDNHSIATHVKSHCFIFFLNFFLIFLLQRCRVCAHNCALALEEILHVLNTLAHPA